MIKKLSFDNDERAQKKWNWWRYTWISKILIDTYILGNQFSYSWQFSIFMCIHREKSEHWHPTKNQYFFLSTYWYDPIFDNDVVFSRSSWVEFQEIQFESTDHDLRFYFHTVLSFSCRINQYYLILQILTWSYAYMTNRCIIYFSSESWGDMKIPIQAYKLRPYNMSINILLTSFNRYDSKYNIRFANTDTTEHIR